MNNFAVKRVYDQAIKAHQKTKDRISDKFSVTYFCNF